MSQIRTACTDFTCFYITGHGIGADVMDDILEFTKKYFSLPLEKKNAMKLSKSTSFRGYIQLGEENKAPFLTLEITKEWQQKLEKEFYAYISLKR